MKKNIKANIVAFFIIGTTFITGCSEEREPTVNWNNYGVLVKERLDSYIANKDCGGFQKEFDTAADNNDNQRRRTGEGNGKLMDYIIFYARNSGCAS